MELPKFQEVHEELKIKKMGNLPSASEKFEKIRWNDGHTHTLFQRIKERTPFSRKQVIEKIVDVLDKVHDQMKHDGSFIIHLTKSGFYLVVFKERNRSEVNVKTVLDGSMKLRPWNDVLTIREAE